MNKNTEEASLSQAEELYYLPNCLAKDRGKDFATDFQYFIVQFDEVKKIPSFAEFKTVWKEAHLQYVHTLRTENEDPKEYYETIYGEIIKMMNNHMSNDVKRLVCVYSLYAIYATQGNEKWRISIDQTTFNNLEKTFDWACENKCNDLAKIIKKLYEESAFEYTYKVGLRTILLDKYGRPRKSNDPLEIKDRLSSQKEKQLSTLKKDVNFESCQQTLSDYKAKRIKVQGSLKELGDDKVYFNQEKNEFLPERENKLNKIDDSAVKWLQFKCDKLSELYK